MYFIVLFLPLQLETIHNEAAHWNLSVASFFFRSYVLVNHCMRRGSSILGVPYLHSNLKDRCISVTCFHRHSTVLCFFHVSCCSYQSWNPTIPAEQLKSDKLVQQTNAVTALSYGTEAYVEEAVLLKCRIFPILAVLILLSH